MRSLVLPLVAINSILVAAQDWNGWDSTVTQTVTRTHTYCPCETTWSTWTSTWASWTGTYTSSWSTTSASTSSSSVSATVTSTSSSTSSSSTTTTTSSSSTTASSTPAGCTFGISPSSSSRVQASFTSSGVVPTLIPAINPQVAVNVNYNGKAVDLGNEFLTTETLLAPTLTFTGEVGIDAQDTTYSYFLVDPDVPSPSGAPVAGLRVTFLHWEVSGAKSICAFSQNPNTVAMYQSLTPASTDQHRYTFLVYREPPNYVPDVVTPQTRVGFDVNAYAAKGGLVLVGGNFLREAITNGILPSTTTSSAAAAIST